MLRILLKGTTMALINCHEQRTTQSPGWKYKQINILSRLLFKLILLMVVGFFTAPCKLGCFIKNTQHGYDFGNVQDGTNCDQMDDSVLGDKCIDGECVVCINCNFHFFFILIFVQFFIQSSFSFFISVLVSFSIFCFRFHFFRSDFHLFFFLEIL